MWLDGSGLDRTALSAALERWRPSLLILPVRELDPDDPLRGGVLAGLETPPLLPSTAGSLSPEDAVDTALRVPACCGLDRVLLQVETGERGAAAPALDAEALLEACAALRGTPLVQIAACPPDPALCEALLALDVSGLAPRLADPAPLRALATPGRLLVPQVHAPREALVAALLRAGAHAVMATPETAR